MMINSSSPLMLKLASRDKFQIDEGDATTTDLDYTASTTPADAAAD